MKINVEDYLFGLFTGFVLGLGCGIILVAL